MWVLFAFASAFFAGVTSILAKIGVKDVDSHVATAIRTIIVLIFFVDNGVYNWFTKYNSKY